MCQLIPFETTDNKDTSAALDLDLVLGRMQFDMSEVWSAFMLI